jgi:hypothetical protein
MPPSVSMIAAERALFLSDPIAPAPPIIKNHKPYLLL